jgi:AcrR family transcriptional regulator
MARKVNKAEHERKKHEIMDVAARLFAESGFAATTTARICAEAGISAGALFHYFPTKRALFAAIVTDGTQEEAKQALAEALQKDNPVEGLTYYVEHLAWAATLPIVPGLVIEAMLQAYRDPELTKLLDADADIEREGLIILLSRLSETGQLDPELNIEETASWLMALVGSLYLQAATDDTFDASTQIRFLRRSVVRFVTPRRN